QNIRPIGSEKKMVAGCDATSMNGSRWMSAYRSSMSAGTRLMLTAAGPVGVCLLKRSGRWQRVPNQRLKGEAFQSTSDDIPGGTIRPRWSMQILIGVRWGALRLMHWPRVIVRSDVAK